MLDCISPSQLKIAPEHQPIALVDQCHCGMATRFVIVNLSVAVQVKACLAHWDGQLVGQMVIRD